MRDMMNRCGSTNTHQYGASMGSSSCSCNNSFSYYSTFNDVQHHHHHECCSTTNTTVDCTLSLGTPSLVTVKTSTTSTVKNGLGRRSCPPFAIGAAISIININNNHNNLLSL
ncbi:hypothetical protein Scep_020626 [Stephania cephalantha]|uniref:Uncharacterized protein n=1 Tax=Stephania cephalantha TaxID=152367 RepID=A0AAP0NMM5_9MAGN